MTPLSYLLIPSRFGDFAILWRDTSIGPRVQRVLMPQNDVRTVEVAKGEWGAGPSAVPAITELGDRLETFLAGHEVRFRLDLLLLKQCSEFQRRVLWAEYGIRRGWVSTYGRIARHLGIPRGAQAVGKALAHNPFPIIIPCHRAIASNGSLGGYQGGSEMKRALLEMEGVTFGKDGRVQVKQFYYDE